MTDDAALALALGFAVGAIIAPIHAGIAVLIGSALAGALIAN